MNKPKFIKIKEYRMSSLTLRYNTIKDDIVYKIRLDLRLDIFFNTTKESSLGYISEPFDF